MPSDDLGHVDFFELRRDGYALAWAGLERHGADALLRSVVVRDRGAGAGTELVRQVMRAAADQGMTRLWLLTETAEPFFARFGFHSTLRDDAPEAIRQSSEFAGVCPASAVCMVRALDG